MDRSTQSTLFLPNNEVKYIESFTKLLEPHKLIGLCSCGDVELSELEVKIIDTEEFQRLRYIKQLGSTYTAYPSAIHTRFEHSLGVLLKASQIVNCIRSNKKHSNVSQGTINDRELFIIRLIALLHDICHMPFGHTLEDEFHIFTRHDTNEIRWKYFLGENSSIGKLIIKYSDYETYNLFYKLISCEGEFKADINHFAFIYDIVSNTICADLLDYLERDGLYTNLKLNYHTRFLNFFFIYTKEEESDFPAKISHPIRRLAIRLHKSKSEIIRKDLISELIQLLGNRYFLGERVYYHHNKIASGTMIAAAIKRSNKAKLFKVLTIENPDLKMELGGLKGEQLLDIHLMGDDELLRKVASSYKALESKVPEKQSLLLGASSLAKNVLNRRLHKIFCRRTRNELLIDENTIEDLAKDKNYQGIRPSSVAIKLFNINQNAKTKTHDIIYELEEEIAGLIPNCNSGDVLFYCPTYSMAFKAAKVLVSLESKHICELRDLTDPEVRRACNSIIKRHLELWTAYVFVNPELFERNKDIEPPLRNLLQLYVDWKLFSSTKDEYYYEQIFYNKYTDFLILELMRTDEIDLHYSNSKIEDLKESFKTYIKSEFNTGSRRPLISYSFARNWLKETYNNI